jgi:hypothetical protein
MHSLNLHIKLRCPICLNDMKELFNDNIADFVCSNEREPHFWSYHYLLELERQNKIIIQKV